MHAPFRSSVQSFLRPPDSCHEDQSVAEGYPPFPGINKLCAPLKDWWLQDNPAPGRRGGLMHNGRVTFPSSAPASVLSFGPPKADAPSTWQDNKKVSSAGALSNVFDIIAGSTISSFVRKYLRTMGERYPCAWRSYLGRIVTSF